MRCKPEHDLLVLGKAVIHHDQRIALARIEAGRQVDIEVAAMAEGARPDAIILAVIGREIHDLAANYVAEVVLPETAVARETIHQELETQPPPQC